MAEQRGGVAVTGDGVAAVVTGGGVVTRGLTEVRVDIAGIRVSYWEYPGPSGPSTPTVFFLHGLGGDHHGLEQCAKDLAGWRVIVPDLPGSGMSGPLSGRHDLGTYAGFVGALRRHLQLDQIALVGHSFGAAIALTYARRSPERVSRLVLLQPVTGTSGSLAGKLAARYTQVAGHLPDAAFRRLVGNAAVVRLSNRFIMTTGDRSVRAAINDRDLVNYRRMNVRAFTETAEAMRTAGIAALLPDPGIPTLVVAADRDVVVPRRLAAALATRLAGSRLLVVAGGHLFPMEDPVLTGRIIEDFISAPETRLPVVCHG